MKLENLKHSEKLMKLDELEKVEIAEEARMDNSRRLVKLKKFGASDVVGGISAEPLP